MDQLTKDNAPAGTETGNKKTLSPDHSTLPDGGLHG